LHGAGRNVIDAYGIRNRQQALTVGELDRARRELQTSLALVRPDSPARVPILAHMSAIDAELADRTASTPPNTL
jgi:hypothetical protein